MKGARHVAPHARWLALGTALLFSLVATNSGAVGGHAACEVCHVDPSPGPATADLLMPEPQLCLSCHPDQSGPSNHVIGVAPTPGMPTTLPLSNGVMICSTCHDLHATTPTLVRTYPGGICFGCHHE
jgi:predicted CXXCH cytochrome family protein